MSSMISEPAPQRRPAKLWRPRWVLITPQAREFAQGRAIVERAASLGAEVVELSSNRLTGLAGEDPRRLYNNAKSTLAVVVSPPSKRRLQPIAPSADWRFDLAEGCPAHCQYCYLAGSLSGPPVTRVYANIEEILEGLSEYAGRGVVTSASPARAAEGTTYEASCYTDPLGIEHLTGSLAKSISYFGAWDAPVQLRFTTKYDTLEPLLTLHHNQRTRMRFSVNSAPVARFEGGTPAVSARLRAMRSVALVGYPVGLTIAPIMPKGNWREAYNLLLEQAASALAGLPGVDLTVELITHRFTPKSKTILNRWYTASELEMDESRRAVKRTKFGSVKYVYPAELMREMRAFFDRTIAERLPMARLLYWT
jgi:spore photoproduct lyase